MSYNVLTRTAGQGYGGAVRRMLAGGKGDSGNTQNPQEKDNANGTGVDDCNRYCSTYYKAVRVGGGPGIHTHTHTHTHTQNNPALLCNPLWSLARALASRRTRLLFFQTVYSFKQLKRISLCTERRRRNYFERHGGGNIGKPI